jgi:hypothetical protein
LKEYHLKFIEFLREGGDYEDYQGKDREGEIKIEWQMNTPIVYRDGETPIGSPEQKKMNKFDRKLAEMTDKQAMTAAAAKNKIDDLNLELIEQRLLVQEYIKRIQMLND